MRTNNKEKASGGFTLIELMVAFSIIAILSSLLFAYMNSARDRGRVAGVARQLNELNRALVLWADSANRTRWWTEAQLNSLYSTSASNPTFADLISKTPISTFISVAPAPPFGGNYIYDNDNDADTCGSGTESDGVTIAIIPTTAYMNTELDKLMDGANGRLCGKIQWPTDNSATHFIVDADGVF